MVAMTGFGKWLVDRRKAANLLQSDVAKKAGVSVSYVSTLEREQPHSITGLEIVPNRKIVTALAKAVRGNVEEALDFFGYAPDKPPTSGLIVPPYPKKPKNIAEFFEVLGSLGDFEFSADLSKFTEDDFEALLERIKADVEITVRRKNR